MNRKSSSDHEILVLPVQLPCGFFAIFDKEISSKTVSLDRHPDCKHILKVQTSLLLIRDAKAYSFYFSYFGADTVFSKSISAIFNELISPLLKAVATAKRIRIFIAECDSAAINSF